MAGYGTDALEALSPGRLPIGEANCLKAPHAPDTDLIIFDTDAGSGKLFKIAVASPIRRPHPPNPAPPVASVLPWHYAEASG